MEGWVLGSKLSKTLVACAVATVSAIIAMMIVTLVQGEKAETGSREDTSNRSIGPKRRPGSTRHFDTKTRLPALPPTGYEGRDLADIPDLGQIEKRYRGLGKAYQSAFDAARARTLKRASRRCLTKLPDSVKEVTWDTVESYELSADKRSLVRSDIEVIPGTTDQSPFTGCYAEAIQSDGEFRIDVPENVEIDSLPIILRNRGVIYLDNDIPAAYLEKEILALRERAGSTTTTPDQRAALQDQIELYECYKNLGMSRKRECLAR